MRISYIIKRFCTEDIIHKMKISYIIWGESTWYEKSMHNVTINIVTESWIVSEKWGGGGEVYFRDTGSNML